MQMTGEYRIEAPRDKVWEALNDPEVLKASIPGCEEMHQTGDDSFEAKVRAKVGPVNAKFAGSVKLSDINPPESYTISGEGKGGAAGFASGGAKVRLEEVDGGATQLHYDVEAKVGGKMAQLGSRLIDSTAKKMADQFFANFAQQVSGEPAKGGTATGAEAPPKPEEAGPVEPEAVAPAPAPAPAPPPSAAPAPAGPPRTAAEAPAPAGVTPEAQMAKQPEGQDTAGRDPRDVQRRAAQEATRAVSEARKAKSMSPIVWVVGLIAVVIILWVLFA
jgi:hypothetical protein